MRRILLGSVGWAAMVVSAQAATPDMPFKNPALPVAQRVDRDFRSGIAAGVMKTPAVFRLG